MLKFATRHAPKTVQPTASRSKTRGQYSSCGAHAAELDGSPYVQAKLKVGPPSDSYEQKADCMAAQVMRTPQPAIRPQVETQGGASAGSAVSSQIHSKIDGLRHTGGSPLPPSTRAFIERRFGHGFSNVRVFTETAADRLCRDLDARAFTVGSDIFFRDREFQPNASSGMQLLAHELTHVLQQQAGDTTPTTLRRAPPTATVSETGTTTSQRKLDVTVVTGDTRDPLHDRAQAIAKGRLEAGESDIAIAIMKIEDIHNFLQLSAARLLLVPQERIDKWMQGGDFYLVPDEHPGFVNKLSIIGHGREGKKGDEPFYQFGALAYTTSDLAALHSNGLDFSRYMVSGGAVVLEGCDAAAGDAGRLFMFQIGQIFFGSNKSGRITANTEKSMPFAGTVIGGSPRTLNWPSDFLDLAPLSPPAASGPIRHEEWSGAGLNVLLTWLPSGRVIGTYGDSGSITGSLNGNRVDYAWRDENLEGKGYWILSADTQKLTGSFGYGESDSGGGEWNLVKK
jgi:Domain of unknown function (DUF4157)